MTNRAEKINVLNDFFKELEVNICVRNLVEQRLKKTLDLSRGLLKDLKLIMYQAGEI